MGCALCLLTASAIPRTGPLWGWGFCPGSRRPRARVPLVVWAWDLVVYTAPPHACEAHLRLCFDRLEAYHGQIPQQPVRGCQTRSHSHALGSGGTADGTCLVARRLGRKRILLRRVVAGTGNDQDVSVTSKGSTKFTRAEQAATGTVQVVRGQVEDLGMRRDPTCRHKMEPADPSRSFIFSRGG